MVAYVPSLRKSKDNIVSVLGEFGYSPDSSYPPHDGKFDRMYFKKETEPYPRMVAFHNLPGYVGISMGHLMENWERWAGITPYKMDRKDPENEEEFLQQIRNTMGIAETKTFPRIETNDKSEPK
ncbi:MAG: hypothetical protein HYW24_05170 [Candidatus Aenigmarchaeota archaeon]|nr:hypothetical protein [Candidatus Aenigmarchaeota archaeon]